MTGGLKLRDRERSRFFFFVAVNCLMNIGLTIGQSVSEGLFLSRQGLGPAMLPEVFIITAVATALSTFFYASYVDKVRNDRYFQILNGIATGALAVILLGVRADSTPAFMALYGFFYVVQGIFNTHFWNYATDYFDAVEAKRLFPFFPLGNSVGGFCGGVLAGALGGVLSPLGLAATWLGILLATAVLIGAVSPRLRGWVVSESEESDEASLSNVRQGFRFLLRSKLGRWHMAYALVMIVSLFFLQYLYSDILATAYPDAEQLTAFIGRFLAVTNVVEVVLEITFTPQLIRIGGVGASNAFYPLSTLVGFALIGTLHNVTAAVYSRMNRETFENAVSGACRNLLFNAYPSRLRGRVRAFIEGAVTNTGIVIAGLALMGLSQVFPPHQIGAVVTWLGGVSALIFLGIALRIRHEYLDTLLTGLRDYRLDLEDVNLELDKVPQQELLDVLPTLESEDDPASIATVQRMLRVLARRGSLDAVTARLEHANPNVQLAALDVLFGNAETAPRADETAALHAILQRVLCSTTADPEVRACALEALARTDRLAGATDWLRDGAPRVRAATAAILMQRQGAEAEAAWRVVRDMIDDPSVEARIAMLRRLPMNLTACRNLVLASLQDADPEVRRAALDRMEHLDPQVDEVRLRVQPLLDDRKDEVRVAVIRFLGRSRDESLIDTLAARLDDDSIRVRRVAIETLHAWGSPVVPHVRPLLEAPSTHTVSAALAVLGGLPEGEAREDVRRWLEQRLALAHDAVIAESAVLAATAGAPTALESAHGRVEDGSRGATEPLMVIALRDFVKRTIGLVLDGLESLEDPTVIRNIRRCLETQHRQARGDAMEALSSLRERTLAAGLLALLEDGSTEERRAASVAWRGLQAGPPWSEIMVGLQGHPDRWIRVAAAVMVDGAAPAGGGADYRQTKEYAVMKHLLFLKKVPLFAQMSLEQLEIISRIVNELTFFKGEVIFREGEIGDKLFVIVEGKVNVVKGYRAASQVTLAILGPTDYFGEMSVLDNEPRSATILIAEDARLLSISGEKLRDIVQQKPEIAFEIFKVLSSRLRRADQKVAELAQELLDARSPAPA